MGKKFASDSPTIEEIRNRKKPYRRSVDIVLDPEISTEIHNKQTLIELAEKGKGMGVGKSLAEADPKPRLEAELEKLWERADEEGAIQTFWFKDPGKKAYDDLVTAHPPSKEQKEEWKEGGGEGVLSYDPDTFVPALIALCSDDPVIPLDDAIAICDEWGTGDVILLFNAALHVCQSRPGVPLRPRSLTDTVETPSSDSNSTGASE